MSNSTNSNSDKVSIALIVSLLGLAIFLVLSVMGDFIKNGDMSIGLLKSLSFTAVFAFLLWLLKYAKTRESNLKKWRVVEWGMLGGYVIIAVFSIFFSGLPTFVSVNTEKESLKQIARSDIDAMNNQISSFVSFETNELDNTLKGLRNTVNHQNLSKRLKDYIKQNNFIRPENSDGIISDSDTSLFKMKRDGFLEQIELVSVDNSYYNGDDGWGNKLNECSSTVETWNLFKLPELARKMEDVSEEISSILPEFYEHNKFPTIKNINGTYDIEDEGEQFSCNISLKFPQKLRSIQGVSIITIIMMLLIHFLILFCYIFSFRSNRVEIGRGQNQNNLGGGHILTID